MISSIERGIVNPSVDILFKICNALEVSVDYFLPTKNDREALTIFRRKDQFHLKSKKTDSYFVSPVFQKHGYTVLLAYLKPGAEYGRKHITHETNELIVVIKGEIIFHYGQKEYELVEGDSVYFSSSILHYVINRANSMATIVWSIFKA